MFMYLFIFWVRTFKFYSLSKFQWYNSVLSTIVIMFYTRSSDLFHLFLKIFNGVELIYNVVLVSGVQQSESVKHIHRSTLFFFFLRFFSHIGHYRVLSRVPCAIQQVLIRPPSPSTWKLVGTLLPTSSHFPPPPAPGNHFSTLCFYETDFLFFLDSTYVISCSICLSLSNLCHLAKCLQVPSILSQMAGFPSFSWLNNIPLYIYNTSSLSIHQLMDT